VGLRNYERVVDTVAACSIGRLLLASTEIECPKMRVEFRRRCRREHRAQLGSNTMRCGLALGIALLSGCQNLPLRPGFYSIAAPGADYPVMISKVSGKLNGRPIEASTDYESRASGAVIIARNTTVYVETRRSSRSEMPAREKLLFQVRRRDRWVQFEGGRFAAKNKSEFAQDVVERSLNIRASAHR
jgi:hypothetical protein